MFNPLKSILLVTGACLLAGVTARAANVEPQAWIGNGPRVRPWSGGTPADRARLSLREAGIYRVTAGELAEAGGWDEAAVATAIANTNLSLSCLGTLVSWLADGDGLLFHGMPAKSRYAPENVYWVTPGPGVAMAAREEVPVSPPATNVSFSDTLTFQGTGDLTRISYSTLGDSANPYVAFEMLLRAKSAAYSLELPDYAPGAWEGALTVKLLSLFEYVIYDDHLARVSMGGTVLGTNAWVDEKYVSFTFPFSSTNLVAGAAELLVENLKPKTMSTDQARFFVVAFDVEYRRRYRARHETLRCSGGQGGTIAVAGFGSEDIIALDVTDSTAPQVIQSVMAGLNASDLTWSASFADGGSGRIYRVSSRTGGLLKPSIRGVRDTDWLAAGKVFPEHVILIPPEGWRDDFRAVLQPLSDFRSAQGLRAEIIDVECLYNSFSGGLVDPLAIRRFCEVAYPGGLSYLLLAGSGSPDYKHLRLSVNDFPACLVPTVMAGQRLADKGVTVALDAALGDVDDDGCPEVAVGRFPTSRTNEIRVAVGKTIAYEGAMLWKRQASIAADYQDTSPLPKYEPYPFAQSTERLVAPLTEAGRYVVRHYVTAFGQIPGGGADIRENSLFPALWSGSGIFFFFGHTSNVNLGSSETRMLYKTDITPNRWQRTPIAIVIGCLPNRWQSLTETVSILPLGLFAEGTGFAAVMGATCNMLPYGGETLAVALLSETGGTRAMRLGDVWLRGLRATHGTGILSREELLGFSLCGDPALVYRHDVTATGTDTAWLAALGLVEPNADLADHDGDGWPTWREFTAGTDPLGHQLRITEAYQPQAATRTLAFESASNATYRVMFSPRLDGTAWEAVPWKPVDAPEWHSAETPIPAQGPVTTVSVLANSGAIGFYRIQRVGL